MKSQEFDYIICGGGASGLLLLNGFLDDPFFKNKTILLIEKEEKNSNDRTWCFWEKESLPLDLPVAAHWTAAQFDASQFSLPFSLLPYRYKMVRSKPFYKGCYLKVKKSNRVTLLHAEVEKIDSLGTKTSVTTATGEFISKCVFSSIYDPQNLYKQKKYPVLQQHFVGWFVRTKTVCFDPNRIRFMDFDIPQKGQTRFMYVLPLDSKNALFEYTLFSAELLPLDEYEKGIKNYLEKMGINEYEIVEKEQGSIPMTSFPFEKENTPSLLHIGTAGGWTKASTGFTFLNTKRQVKRLLLFLKENRPLTAFTSRNRFYYYDLLFLDVLSSHNALGGELFKQMFSKNTPQRIFRFLDEQTSKWEELRILSSFTFQQKFWFLRALVRRIF